MGCPSEETLVEYAQRQLAADEATPIEQHIDGCAACRSVLAALVQVYDDFAPVEPSSAEVDTLTELGPRVGLLPAPGQRVGRYHVLDRVGSGAMGVVYEAYDPELDRRVALKLLHRTNDPDDRLRMQREARALARLSHPNVTTVHDVGEFDGRVFLAMEFVLGTTLRAWLTARPRTWPEIRATFLAAGRGLAATHAAGIVHRDFKPDNVMVGEDGRVRVTDFGLARLHDAVDTQPAEVGVTARIERSVDVTRTGTMVGTPAYMAPEVLRGQSADARSDQFSFCVALFEAIHGKRPHAGRALAELATNVLDGARVEVGNAPGIPRTVRDAIHRGLSLARADRFADMDELLAVLEDPARRRWRALAIAAPLVIAAIAGPMYIRASGATPPQCRDAEMMAWSDDVAVRLRETLAEIDREGAGVLGGRVVDRLDRYAAALHDERAQVCTEVDAAGAMDAREALRLLCLEEAGHDADNLLALLADADADLLERAPGLVDGLPRPSGCRDPVRLRHRVEPEGIAARARVAELRGELRRARLLGTAERYPAAFAVVDAVEAEARDVDFPTLRAEVQWLRGNLSYRSGDVVTGIDRLWDAVWTATEVENHALAADALASLLHAYGKQGERPYDTDQLLRHGLAELAAMGGDADLEAELYSGASVAFLTAGEVTSALDMAERALDRTPPQAIGRISRLVNLASLETLAERIDDAVDHFEEARELRILHSGDDAIGLATIERNLGIALLDLGRIDEADAALSEAEARWSAIDAEHGQLPTVWLVQSWAAASAGDGERAVERATRAFELSERSSPGDPINVAPLVALAEGLELAGRLDEARARADQAIALAIAGFGPDHPHVLEARIVAARIAVAQRRMTAARREFGELRRIAALGAHDDTRREAEIDDLEQAIAEAPFVD